MKIKLFLDLEGTIARYTDSFTAWEDLMKSDKFQNMKLQKNLAEAIRIIKKDYSKQFELYLLCNLPFYDKRLIKERNQWIDHHLPEIDFNHRFYLKREQRKEDFVKLHFGSVDWSTILLDDYRSNCVKWKKAGGISIHFVNELVSEKGNYQGEVIHYDNSPFFMISRLWTSVLTKPFTDSEVSNNIKRSL